MTDNKNKGKALARLRGPGVYPVEFAGWLLNPLRHLICPAGLIVRRLRLEPSDRVLEIGSGPGYFSPSIARRLVAGQLMLFDMQAGMLDMAARRLAKHESALSHAAPAMPHACRSRTAASTWR